MTTTIRVNLNNFRIFTSRHGSSLPENDYARRCGALPYIRARAPLREAPTLSGHGVRRAGQRQIELLGLAQHCVGSRSLSQIYDRCSTSIVLVEECLVIHASVDSDRKLVGFAGSTTRYEYLRWLVHCNFEHSLTHRSVITIVRDFEPERLTSS
jgi:hypothetical protein